MIKIVRGEGNKKYLVNTDYSDGDAIVLRPKSENAPWAPWNRLHRDGMEWRLNDICKLIITINER